MSNPTISKQTLQVNEESFEDVTIQRCPHDESNSFTLIKNDLIRDMLISPECRWLVIYLLSNKEGWKINVKQLIQHLKPHMGRDKVHALFNEAIKAGYIKRESFGRKNPNGGLFKCFRYIVSETPKFKEIIPCTENQDTGNRCTENQYPGFQYTKEILSKRDNSLKVLPTR